VYALDHTGGGVQLRLVHTLRVTAEYQTAAAPLRRYVGEFDVEWLHKGRDDDGGRLGIEHGPQGLARVEAVPNRQLRSHYSQTCSYVDMNAHEYTAVVRSAFSECSCASEDVQRTRTRNVAI
jgi:hypothetical protein